MKKCPFCAEDIQDEAIKCRFCGSMLNSGPTTPTPDPNEDVRQLVLQGKKIDAIKLYRERTGLGLKEAKDAVEALARGVAIPSAATPDVAGVPPKKKGKGCLVALGIFLGLVFLGYLLPSTPKQSSAPPVTVATPAPAPTSPPPSVTLPAADKLALLSARGYETEYGGYHIVEGQVTNISDEPLRNVTVVATWLDGEGGFITSDDALIEYNPILPGQTSPFKTMTTSNPAMKRYTVSFKELMGGQIPTDDRRRK